MTEKIIGLTVLALILYYFVLKSEQSSKFINASADAYVKGVTVLQGR